jgi:hypothetical protein
MINSRRRSPLVRPDLFVPTWLFPEDLILAGLAGLDDEMLQSIHLGRFCFDLKERIEETEGRARK